MRIDIAIPRGVALRYLFLGSTLSTFLGLLFFYESCSAFTACLASEDAYIIGADGAERRQVARVIGFSAQRFEEMVGRRPAYGIVLLDRRQRTPLIAQAFSRWTLPYFPTPSQSDEAPALGALPGDLVRGRRSYRGSDPFSIAFARKTLSHEACHMFAQAHTRGRRIPMAFEEVVAVGCEIDSLRKGRERNYKNYNLYKDWDTFIVSGHPLDFSGPAARPKTKNAKVGFEVFEIPKGDMIENQISEYYSKSALLGSFLSRACPERFPVGRILDKIDRNFDFSAWLVSENDGCLGGSSESFSKRINAYAEKLSS